MIATDKVSMRFYRFKRHGWVLAVTWTSIVAISLWWNVIQIQRNTLEAARIQARTAYEKDVVYRRWNTLYGAVYVEVTELS